MKIVILPGVGFHKESKKPELYDVLVKAFPNDTVEYFVWQHYGQAIQVPWKDGPITGYVRNFVTEVILDFDTVVAHLNETYIPPADVYIGHSAGSILAIAQLKPAIVFGSPFQMVSQLQIFRAPAAHAMLLAINAKAEQFKANPHIYNIVNKEDVIALPMTIADNWLYRSCWTPIGAHLDYWSNSKVQKKIVERLKMWQKDGIV